MEIKIKEHFVEVHGSDNNGEFKVSIQNNCSQLRIETGMNDAFIDLNYYELKTIRNAITGVLNSFDSKFDQIT